MIKKIKFIAIDIAILLIGAYIVYWKVFTYPYKLSECITNVPVENAQYLSVYVTYNGENKDYYISADDEVVPVIYDIIKDIPLKPTTVKVDTNPFNDNHRHKNEPKNPWYISYVGEGNDGDIGTATGERRKLSISGAADLRVVELSYYTYIDDDIAKKLWECISEREWEFTLEDLRKMCERKDKILYKDLDFCSNIIDHERITFENGWFLNLSYTYSPEEEPEVLVLFKSPTEYMDIRDEGIMEFINEE